jgi:hypothetical protein
VDYYFFILAINYSFQVNSEYFICIGYYVCYLCFLIVKEKMLNNDIKYMYVFITSGSEAIGEKFLLFSSFLNSKKLFGFFSMKSIFFSLMTHSSFLFKLYLKLPFQSRLFFLFFVYIPYFLYSFFFCDVCAQCENKIIISKMFIY